MNKPKSNYTSNPEQLNTRDFFQTPNYATKLLLPYIPETDLIWECAVGEGKIANILSEKYIVYGSDIYPHTENVNIHNFLTDPSPVWNKKVTIISNPPFSNKKAFAYKCLNYNFPFALLMPLDFNGWICDLVKNYGVQLLIPQTRINFVTPSGKSGKDSAAQFHSAWFCYKFNLPKDMTIVDLTPEMKKDI